MHDRRPPDPRVIFALALALSGFAVAVREVRFMALLLGLSLACAALMGVSFAQLARRVKRLVQVVLIVALMQSLFQPSGRVLVRIGSVPIITLGGLLTGASVLMRLMVLLVTGALIASYPSRQLIQGMVQLRLPFEVAYMVSVGVRFVPMLSQQLRDGLTALQLRGVVIEALPLRKRLSLYTYMLLPTLAASLRSAQELSMSMDMRAFRAARERSSYFTLHWSKRDTALVALIAACSAALVTAIFIR